MICFCLLSTVDPGIDLGDTSMSVARRDLANAVRALSMGAVEKANSGHPGAPMGMARFEAFGCSGNASRIQPRSVEIMSQRYLAGERDPRLQ